MTESDILFEVNDKGIAVITLNRPEKYNALTRHMTMDVLPGMFEKVQTDNDIRVLVITGAGQGVLLWRGCGEKPGGRAGGHKGSAKPQGKPGGRLCAQDGGH